MDRFQCIRTFIEVAQAKSFTAAARQLGVSKATITKQVAALEEDLGVNLFNRNSKHVSLTDAGAVLLDGGNSLIFQLNTLSANVQNVGANLRGIIRVGAPPSFGALFLAPAIAAFAQREPGVEIWLILDDGHADLVRDGLDMSIRVAANPISTSEISKLLGRAPQRLVASTEYLERFGIPEKPEDLKQHNCLVHCRKTPTNIWKFVGPNGDCAIHVNGSMKSNFSAPLRLAVLLGHGISILPGYVVEEDIEAKRLYILMEDYVAPELTVSAIYPTRTRLPPRVRAFLDFLKNWIRAEKYLN